MREILHLDPAQLLPERPFTDPANITADFATMQYMLTQLHLLLEYPYSKPDAGNTVHFKRPGEKTWFHRLLLARPERLRTQRPLRTVGFFGERREEADVELAHDFDRMLIGEIDDHPGLLSYSTMELDQGNYANLVIFGDQDARESWSRSRAHAQAVDLLAPGYYWSVCIYNGALPGGVRTPDDFFLKRVKYFDYRSAPTWRAIREITEEGNETGFTNVLEGAERRTYG